MMTASEWYHKYYSEENKQLLDIVKGLEFGKIEVEVHQKSPVFILQPMKKIKIQRTINGKNIRKL